MCCCCWSIKVTVRVTGNLVLRVCADLTDALYKILERWLCCYKRSTGDGLNLNPWYKAVDRKQAEILLEAEQVDGAFLIRPSSEHVCTLSIWQDSQVFHINVRKRVDGWLALGKSKPNEYCFETVQDIIEFYRHETLVIDSSGVQFLTVLK